MTVDEMTLDKMTVDNMNREKVCLQDGSAK